ncbi:MANNAN SYNTHESIS-RELATED 2-like protein [Drosera capensis]
MTRFSQVGSKGGHRSEVGRKREEGVGLGCCSICGIMVDPRQIVAGFLTFSMFAMLAHMIKREHFDSVAQVKLPQLTDDHFKNSKLGEQTAVSFPTYGPWREDGPELKPCWGNPSLDDEAAQSKGFVTFSLTDGPEYHISQIADAVVVAKSLGATLVLPDIRGSRLGDRRNFEEVYDAEKFVSSLDGVIKVVKKQPSKISRKNLAVVRVPNRVTEEHIAENIKPIFSKMGNIRLATYFPSLNMKKSKEKSSVDSLACLAMFGTLELQPEIRDAVDSMVDRLKTLSKSEGRFVAVDLRVDVLDKKGCQGNGNTKSKSCYNAGEIAEFLRKTGFDKDTIVYLTQSRWDSSLDTLKEYFPKTYTKEGIMPGESKGKFLNSETPTLEEVIDFYICTQSDVFVPAISGLFYANVAGKRITAGKTEILVPDNIQGSFAPAENYISHYVTKKNHLAYSCFC